MLVRERPQGVGVVRVDPAGLEDAAWVAAGQFRYIGITLLESETLPDVSRGQPEETVPRQAEAAAPENLGYGRDRPFLGFVERAGAEDDRLDAERVQGPDHVLASDEFPGRVGVPVDDGPVHSLGLRR